MSLKRRGVRALLGIVLVLVLTGCWDQRPVESRAAVAAIGIDPTPFRGIQRYTFMFPDSTITASSLSSTTRSQEFYPLSVTAPSLLLALKQLQAKQSRALYLGQVRIVAFSTALPASIWSQTMFDMADSARFVLTLWVVGTVDAQRLVELTPSSEVVPEVALYRALTCHCQPVQWPGRGWRIWDMAATPGVSIHAADVAVSSHAFAIHSLLVVGHRVQPWSEPATTGWAYLTGHINHDLKAVTVGGAPVTVALIRGTSNLQIRGTPHHVVVTDDLHYSGVLIEGGATAGRTPSDAAVERAVTTQIQHDIQAAWQASMHTGTDPMGWHRDATWVDQRWTSPVSDWKGWRLDPVVHFTLREEGILR